MGGRVRRRCQFVIAAGVLLLAASPLQALSFEAERELGSQFALAARAKLPLMAEPAIVSYVDTIGQRIARSLEGSFFDYHFFVVRDGRMNAFSVPGGYIYVHSGLLIGAQNEDEIAGVLGHEIAHVHAHHLARQQEATQLLNYATLLGVLLSVVQPAIGAVATGANAAVQLSYRREFEQEADFMAVRYVQSAGYDARATLDFFKRLTDEQRMAPTSAPPYLSSHPLTDERLNHLEAVLRTQQWAGYERRAKTLDLKYVQALIRAQAQPPGDVVAEYRAAVETTPSDPVARYLFGVVCLETGHMEAAGDALEGAQRAGVDPAPRDLGRLALRVRDAERARSLLQKASQSLPGDVSVQIDLARANEALGDTAAAMAAYRKAIELGPDMDAAHYGLGLLAGRAGNEVDGFYHLATAQRLVGDYRQALSQYVRAEALLSVGDGRRAEARTWIRRLSEFLGVREPKEPSAMSAPR